MIGTEYSLSDIAAVTGKNGNNDDGMFGGNNGWWIILLLLVLGRGYGFGGGYGGQGGGYSNGSCGYPCATQADISAGFANSAVLSNLNDIALGQANIQQTLCQGFGGVNTAIGNLGYNIQGGLNTLSHQLSDCCCTTQRAIDGVNYNIATNTCALQNTINNSTRDILENANANSRAILDFLTTDKINTLTAENQSLRFQASQTAQNAFITANQEAQTAELIRRLGRDCPIPAYVVPNPNCCYQSNGCGNYQAY